MKHICATLICICTAILHCGCKSLEKAVRHEQERKVREIVHEEVPVVVRHQIGDWAIKVLPYGLAPLVGGGVLLHKRKKNGSST